MLCSKISLTCLIVCEVYKNKTKFQGLLGALLLFMFSVCALMLCDSGILLYTQFILAVNLNFTDTTKTSKIPSSHLEACSVVTAFWVLLSIQCHASFLKLLFSLFLIFIKSSISIDLFFNVLNTITFETKHKLNFQVGQKEWKFSNSDLEGCLCFSPQWF